MRPTAGLTLVLSGCLLVSCDRLSSGRSSTGDAEGFPGTSIPAVTTAVEGVPDSVQLIANAPACDCEIRMRLAVTIADADGRAGLSSPVAMARLADGRFLVVPSVESSAILVFDREGRFQERIGRRGQGPGEYASIRALASMRGDSILVLDLSTRRLSVLGSDLRYARSAIPPQIGGWIAPLADGRLLVLTGIAAPDEEATDRIVLLDPFFGSIVGSFLPPESPPSSVPSARRRMSATPEGTVVVVHNIRYLVEIWEAGGQRVKSLARSPDWFPLGLDEESLGAAGVPLLEMAELDDEGVLWTVIHRDDEGAQPPPSASVPPPPVAISGQTIRTARPPRGSIVEAVDPESEVLLATLPVDRPILFMLPGRRAVTYREDEAGQPFIDVWQLELRR